jgi:hypothetical protein
MKGDADFLENFNNDAPADYTGMSETDLQKHFKERAENYNSIVDKFKLNGYDKVDENAVATVEAMQDLDSKFDLLMDAITPAAFDSKNSAKMLDKLSPVIGNIDDSHKHYFSLAMYILIKEGEITCPPESKNATSPHTIGASVSAVFETIKAKIKGIKGKITWNNVKAILKKAFNALMKALEYIGYAYIIFLIGGPEVLVFLTECAIAFLTFVSVVTVAEWIESGEARAFWDDAWAKIKNAAADVAVKSHSWYEEFVAWFNEKAQQIKEAVNNFIEANRTKAQYEEDNEDVYEEDNNYHNQPAF